MTLIQSPITPIRAKRENTAFSTFSQARSATSTFLPSASQRDITPFASVLDAEPLRPPNVTGRSDIANFSIAEQLKQLLDSDGHPTPPPPSPTATHTSINTGHSAVPRRAGGAAHRLLTEAFRREYSVIANEHRKRAYSTMYTEEDEQERTLPRFSRAPSLAPSMLSDMADAKPFSEGRKRSRTASVAPSQSIRSAQPDQPGLGAQDIGIGVIGSRAFLEEDEEDIALDQACDIPVPQAVSDWKVKRVDGDEAKITVGPHVISLEQDLAPLATEHPARVWNCILHSLPQEIVPTIQWKYGRMGEVGDSLSYVCQVTVCLPPTHPAIAGRTDLSSLPTSHHMAEYVLAVGAIGGSKTWTGSAQAQKTDATTSALTSALLGDAFEWLHNPCLGFEQAALVVDELDELSAQAVCDSSDQATQALMSSSILDKADHGKDDASAELDVNSRDATSPKLVDITAIKMAVPDDVIRKTVRHSCSDNIAALIEETFKNLPLSSKAICTLTIESDGYHKGLLERLTVGIEGCTQQYQATNEIHAAMGETVLKLAEREGLHDFLNHLQDRYKDSRTPRLGMTDRQAIEVPTMGSPDDADMLVDWVEQLKGFCRTNNLRYPSYSQQVQKSDKGVKFQASMRLEEDFFRAVNSYDTILVARQEIARWVYVEHFGQRAQPMDSSSMRDGPDGGWKGGARGGKNGKGKKRW